MIAEYDGSNALLRRYVHGQGTDNPLVWYEGAGTGNKSYFYADERGSITALTSSTGTVTTIYGYDEYGLSTTLSGSTSSRFRYTGQTWLPEVGLYYYKARMYAPSLGRFMQPDPIGYGDGMNLYTYVHGDPINGADPSGLCDEGGTSSGDSSAAVVVTICGAGNIGSFLDSGSLGSGGNDNHEALEHDTHVTDDSTVVLVTGKKKKKEAYTDNGRGRGGGPDEGEDPHDYEDYQRDLDRCRYDIPYNKAYQSACYQNAEKRRFARQRGRPLPPLMPWASRTGEDDCGYVSATYSSADDDCGRDSGMVPVYPVPAPGAKLPPMQLFRLPEFAFPELVFP